jgi:hypothetical protein
MALFGLAVMSELSPLSGRKMIFWNRLAKEQSDPTPPRSAMDCFAEPVIGLAEGETRWLAMTGFETLWVWLFEIRIGTRAEPS